MKKMNKKGFTLVEMLVVIAIIAILVSILIPTVLGATKKAKAATDAANLRSALAEFEIWALTNGYDFDANAGKTVKLPDGFNVPKSKTNSGDFSIMLDSNGTPMAYFGDKKIDSFAADAGNAS